MYPLQIVDGHLIYEHDGRFYIIDTGIGMPIFEEQPPIMREAFEIATGRKIDGVVSFLSEGRINLTRDSVWLEKRIADDVPLPPHKWLLPWRAIMLNVPTLSMKVNGVDANVIFDTGARCMFSIGNRNYIKGHDQNGTIKDYSALIGTWSELPCYDNIYIAGSGDAASFEMLGRMLYLTSNEYILFSRLLNADVILGPALLLEKYDLCIDGRQGLAIIER